MRWLREAWRRLTAWWSRAPKVSDADLLEPEVDALLADEMRTSAEAYARTADDLDFSIASIEAVSRSVRQCPREELTPLVAYVGEVLVRHAGAHWGRGGRYGEAPGVVFGKWVADPGEWMRNMQRDAQYPDDYLAEAAATALDVAADPIAAVETAEFRVSALSNWTAQRHQIARWRRRFRNRGESRS